MKYRTSESFRQALEQRLQNDADILGTSPLRLRRLVTFDRFLARLHIAAGERWLLKGGLALDYRLPIPFRTTRDLDISRQDDEYAADTDFASVQALELEDYFSFAVEKAPAPGNPHDNPTVRYRLVASLADRPFERVSIDVSFDDPTVAEPDTLHSPALLQFAEIASIPVRAIPLEQHVAEKVHAYTRVYIDQRRSSRAKDLVDLVLIAESLTLEATQLRSALSVTFDSRTTHSLPSSLPPPPPHWETTYPRIAQEVNLSARAHDGYVMAAQLLDPILSGDTPDGSVWNPVTKCWK